MTQFDYSSIPIGYYDKVFKEGNPIRRCWHVLKFQRIVDCLSNNKTSKSLLDIGCFSGTFLSLLGKEEFGEQLGVDILEDQISFANEVYGTDFRKFSYITSLKELSNLGRKFDFITLIEVIEHLTSEEIKSLFEEISQLLNPGGTVVISTPNYTSTWPVLELILNRVSDVSYEEQHLTKFNYFSAISKLKKIYPKLGEHFSLNFKTTTHFISPFLAGISFPFAMWIARNISHKVWHAPFGNLLLLSFTLKSDN